MNFNLSWLQNFVYTIEFLYMMLTIYIGLMVGAVIIILWNRGRITVRVKSPIAEYSRKIKPESDGRTIIMSKDWSFTYEPESIQRVKRKTLFFHRIHLSLDVYTDAKKAITYNYKQQTVDMPMWDKKQSKKMVKGS